MSGTEGAISPLAEAQAVSLDEYFSRDPEHLTSEAGKRDVEIIVKELRRQREQFALAEAQGKAPKGGTKAKTPKQTVSLEDLDL